MYIKIETALANQIVNTVKDVSGYDVNFIGPNGIIIASTDESRVNTYHEAGQKSAVTSTTIEVDSDDAYEGTKRGVNMPVMHKNYIIGVIGISGHPNDVNKYAYLAQRITLLLIREKELSEDNKIDDNKKQFIINSLINKEKFDYNLLTTNLKNYDLTTNDTVRMILIQISQNCAANNIALIEKDIHKLFDSIDTKLYTYDYPNFYMCVIKDSKYESQKEAIEYFADINNNRMKFAIGKKVPILQLEQSHKSCLTTLKSIGLESNIEIYDNLTIDLILSNIDDNSKQAYLSKVINNIKEDDIELLKCYFDHDMSLAKTCELLFIHKNTLQYKLDKITKKTGYNPRKFKDANVLYLAIKLSV
ncbi:CdaR family transcriptional regulator [Mycoplasma sp. P36-A1]|uniref:CdaR family transcriptional regulator n=1 Tax=Mycoplasma sp. P36-A1 TaxID=3252900 RepID=UPI003C2E35A7